MAAIECPSCGKFLRRGSDSCACGWTSRRELARGYCEHCRNQNPVHRQAHWMDMDPSALSGHLQDEFLEFYEKRSGELSHKLAEISDYRSRYTCKFSDESGHWLSPGQAYLQRVQACEPIMGMAEGYQPKDRQAAA